jgi:hypothetical protein
MKKILLPLLLAAVCSGNAVGLPKAIYVKQGNEYTKFNLGVAGDLKFSDSGRKLSVAGYGEVVNLDNIDYITFSAPVNETALSPSAQKERLLEIGRELLSYVDLKKNRELVLMIDRFTYEGEEGDPFCEYKWPREFWDVHNEFRSAMKSASALAKGAPAAVRKMRSAAVNLYRLADYTGVYTANTKTEKWEKTADADYFEMRYPAADSDFYKVRVEPGKETSRWETPDANVELAKEISISFIKGNDVLASAKIISNLVQDQTVELNIKAETGSYSVSSDMTILNSGISDKLNVYCDGKSLLNAETKVSGKNLLIYDEMYDAVKEATHYHDEDDNCCGEDPSELLSHFFRGSSSLDILGKLQASGKVYNFSKLYDAMPEDGDCYYYPAPNLEVYTRGRVLDWNPETGEIRYTYDDCEANDNMVKYLSNYTDASFSYDNDNKLQGYLSFENVVDEEDGYLWSDETSAYTIKDGFLIYVWRDMEYDENWLPTGNYSPWKYTAYDTDTWESVEFTVEDSDVIIPNASTEVYYELTPKLMFPDLTSFVFDDYFTESAFESLIDDYDEIIDSYYSITGH